MNATQTALIEQFIPLAHKLAYNAYNASPDEFTARGFDDDDLVGEALEGLVKAAIAFDSSRGVPFSSFAFRGVRNAIGYASYQKTANRGYSCVSGEDELEGIAAFGNFEEQCISAVEVEQFVSGLSEKEAYLLSLMLQGRTQAECAKAIEERFHKHYSQAAVSYLLKQLRLKFSEFFVDDDRSSDETHPRRNFLVLEKLV